MKRGISLSDAHKHSNKNEKQVHKSSTHSSHSNKPTGNKPNQTYIIDRSLRRANQLFEAFENEEANQKQAPPNHTNPSQEEPRTSRERTEITRAMLSRERLRRKRAESEGVIWDEPSRKGSTQERPPLHNAQGSRSTSTNQARKQQPQEDLASISDPAKAHKPALNPEHSKTVTGPKPSELGQDALEHKAKPLPRVPLTTSGSSKQAQEEGLKETRRNETTQQIDKPSESVPPYSEERPAHSKGLIMPQSGETFSEENANTEAGTPLLGASPGQTNEAEQLHGQKRRSKKQILPKSLFSRRKKPKRDQAQQANNPYALDELEPKEKVIFGINVSMNVIGRFILYGLLLLILLGGIAGGAGIGYFAYLVSNTEPPSQAEMAAQINRLEQQSTLYYASGEPIANVQSDVVRSVTELDEISGYIIDGLIATEDEYFYEHPGVVPKAIIRAALENILKGSGTGGSTLTQQLVKQQMLTNEVTFDRKANEILLALRLENYFSKDEILTAYLNVSPFGRNNRGENIAGIQAASVGIFGKQPDEVNLNQAAFLVGLPQDPYIYTPYDQNGEIVDIEAGIERMKEVLYRMYRNQVISRDEYEQAIQYDIAADFLPGEPPQEERQSYLYQAVMNGAIEQLMHLNIRDDGYTLEQVYQDDAWYNDYYFEAAEQLRTGGYRVYSTIDQAIYDQLQVSAQAYNDELGVTYDGVYTDPETGEETYYVESVQTGMVVIDNPTGRVLGFVAGTDYENNQIDHAFQMRRSPGSTIKPMAVYGPAIEHNLISPATIIPDTAFVQEYEDGSTWAPTNYGNAVSGEFMTARRALLRSDNLPAVRVYEELLEQGVPVIDYLEKMGFNPVDSYTEEDTQNLAFSLGGVTTGPTVFEETRGFTTFANGGQYIDGYYIDRIEDAFGNVVYQHQAEPVRVFAEDTNYLMVDMLRDTMTEGTGRTANEYMNVPGDWIAKTGISENSKDIWVIASTPQITIGSWIGYDSRYHDYTIDVNDGFGLESVRSQIYWSRIVNDLYEKQPEIFGTERRFEQPASVQRQTILEQTGTLPGRTTVNGQAIELTGPTREDLFKVSNPAPPLTENFLFNATPEEVASFWNSVIASQQSRQRQRNNSNNQQNSNEDEKEDEANNDNPDGDTNEPGEQNPAGPMPEGNTNQEAGAAGLNSVVASPGP